MMIANLINGQPNEKVPLAAPRGCNDHCPEGNAGSGCFVPLGVQNVPQQIN